MWQPNKDKSFIVLGINSGEGAEAAAKVVTEAGLTFPVLLDVNREVTKSYNIKSTPTNFLIDKDGVIQEVRVGAFPSKAAMEESLNQLLAK